MFQQSPSYDDPFCMSPIWMMGNDRERKKFPGLSTNSLSLLLFSIILIWNEVIRIWFTCLIGIFNILSGRKCSKLFANLMNSGHDMFLVLKP